ncbi:MAG: archaeosortase/exosortase family protein [Opitutales bacterium]
MDEPPGRLRRVCVALLLLLYPLIWGLDSGWWHLSPDVVIISTLLPLAWVLAHRFKNEAADKKHEFFVTILASITMVVGVVANSMALMAMGWSGLAVFHLLPGSCIPRWRLWLLSAGAFPWVLLDLQVLGWWFRLSGAALTGLVFDWLGASVTVRGTLLEIDGLAISVEAACGGLQLLQVLMSGGIALTILRFPKARGFWLMVFLLPVLGWLSNTVRIMIISWAGILLGPEFAAGVFHTGGALLVLVTMLALYHCFASIVSRYASSHP